MPALGGRGPIAPRELAKAAKEPSLPKGVKYPQGLDHPSSGFLAKQLPNRAPGPIERGMQHSLGAQQESSAYKQKAQGASAPSKTRQLTAKEFGHMREHGVSDREPLAASTLFPAISTSALAATGPIRNVGEHALGTAKAFVKEPVGVTRKTVSSLPTIATSLAGEGLRVGEETGLGAAKLAGVKVPKGEGEPVRALGEFAKGAAKGLAHTVGEKQGEVEKEVGKEGAANQILTYAPLAGAGGAVAGRLLTKAVRASDVGAKEFAALKGARDAAVIAHQNPAMHDFLSQSPSLKPGRVMRAKAFVHETAAQPRPHLRTAPGSEVPRVEPGAAVKPQPRSPNFFRAAGQTALDNARRTYQLHGLERIAKERADFLRNYPGTHDHVPVSYGQHLANLTRQGEVTPLLQAGGLNAGGKFFGASKQQRMGTSYPGADLRRSGEMARMNIRSQTQPALHDLSPVQRKLIVLAKEGHFPLHDPVKAQQWLKEISQQAKEGSKNGSLIPITHRMTGSDVGRTVDQALKHMDKHGVQSVITPDFQRLVEAVPDERLFSPKDPILQQIPDEVAARKYLPQQQTLDAWATREVAQAKAEGRLAHPDAHVTAAAVKQIHEKLQTGKDLRAQGRAAKPDTLEAAEFHRQADREFAHAKNLADENAKRQGMPTDRAYIQHQRTRGRENWLHTVGKRTPADAKQWRSVLQSQGYRSLDPRLIEDAQLKSVRNRLAVENIAKFHDRFAVPGVDKGLTAREAHAEMLKKGLNPEHYEVAHLGKVFNGIQDRAVGGADMLHLDLNPLDHAKALGDLVQGARGVNPGDTTKGAQIYPLTALKELQGNLGGTKLPMRLYGQAKGRFSSLMLGTNPGWATTMSAVTYPFQALMGGAKPWDFPASAKWYRGLGQTDKRIFDLQTGTDSPFKSTHEVKAEKLGSSAQALRHYPKLDQLVSTMRLFRESPVGRMLHNYRPDRIVLAMERVPRRYARIAVATRHMKGMAIEKMLTEAKGVQAAQSQLEKAMSQLEHAGRMPSDQYMQQILQSRPHMEEVARRTSGMMGEWMRMTNFERNVISKVPLFYPWVRYSINLATKALPKEHPLAYALAGQLGVLSREDMRRLLGTDVPPGKAPLGRAQGGEPVEREYDWAGASQADPLLNQITSLISGTPAGTVGILPPFVGAPIEWAVNRDSFTDKPLKVSEPYKRKGKEETRPPLPGTLLSKGLGALAPYRAALGIAGNGQPQAANSLPWALAPMHYSPRVEQSIEEEREAKEKGGARTQVGKYAIPLLPHKEPGLLRAKLEKDQKQRLKEEQAAGAAAGW